MRVPTRPAKILLSEMGLCRYEKTESSEKTNDITYENKFQEERMSYHKTELAWNKSLS